MALAAHTAGAGAAGSASMSRCALPQALALTARLKMSPQTRQRLAQCIPPLEQKLRSGTTAEFSNTDASAAISAVSRHPACKRRCNHYESWYDVLYHGACAAIAAGAGVTNSITGAGAAITAGDSTMYSTGAGALQAGTMHPPRRTCCDHGRS